MSQNSILSESNPLYIVDGIPFTVASLTSQAIGAEPLVSREAFRLSMG